MQKFLASNQYNDRVTETGCKMAPTMTSFAVRLARSSMEGVWSEVVFASVRRIRTFATVVQAAQPMFRKMVMMLVT